VILVSAQPLPGSVAVQLSGQPGLVYCSLNKDFFNTLFKEELTNFLKDLRHEEFYCNRDNDYTGEIGHVFRMKSAIDSGGKKAS
jgi:hypothetical protein